MEKVKSRKNGERMEIVSDNSIRSRSFLFHLYSQEVSPRVPKRRVSVNFTPLGQVNPAILSRSFTVRWFMERDASQAASSRARGAHFSAPCRREAHRIGGHGAYATTGRLYNNNEHACTRFSRLKIAALKTAGPDRAGNQRNKPDPLSRQFLLARFN